MLHFTHLLLMFNGNSFVFFSISPIPPFQCWKMTEQLRTQTAQFYTTLNQGGGERTKREVKSANFPTLLTMIVVLNTASSIFYRDTCSNGLLLKLTVLQRVGGDIVFAPNPRMLFSWLFSSESHCTYFS